MRTLLISVGFAALAFLFIASIAHAHPNHGSCHRHSDSVMHCR